MLNLLVVGLVASGFKGRSQSHPLAAQNGRRSPLTPRPRSGHCGQSNACSGAQAQAGKPRSCPAGGRLRDHPDPRCHPPCPHNGCRRSSGAGSESSFSIKPSASPRPSGRSNFPPPPAVASDHEFDRVEHEIADDRSQTGGVRDSGPRPWHSLTWVTPCGVSLNGCIAKSANYRRAHRRL